MKTTSLFSEKVMTLFPGYAAQLFAGEKLMVTRLIAEAGADVPAHSHPHEQLSLLLKGELEMVVGDERTVLKAGDTLSIPSNAVHSVHAVTECEIIDVFTPVREDLVARYAKET